MAGTIGSSLFAALAFSGAGYLFHLLDKDGYSAEIKRHNRAMEDLTLAREKWYEAEVRKKDEMNRKRQELVLAHQDMNVVNKALVERLNRTLKTIMWKYFAEHNTKKWLHILDDVTFNYNNSVNRSIKMRPTDVNKDNKDKVWMTLYGHEVEKTKTPKFKVGDIVRVEKYHPGTRFVKGYTFNFTDEKFEIVDVYRGIDPIMYRIKDVETDEIINGRFYERELSLVT